MKELNRVLSKGILSVLHLSIHVILKSQFLNTAKQVLGCG